MEDQTIQVTNHKWGSQSNWKTEVFLRNIMTDHFSFVVFFFFLIFIINGDHNQIGKRKYSYGTS